MPVARQRLDRWLVERGLAPSRERAQALVMAGRVRVDGTPVTKSGAAVRPAALVEVLPGPTYVGRGALKLRGVLDGLTVDVAGRVAVDVGASTGGFTEVLLERGAARVYAVDVGRGQLHERLRADPRVVVCDRVNARHIKAADVEERCSLATVDVSFISATRILPALNNVLADFADVLLLVKPQFEVGRAEVGRGGLVKDPALHRAALRAVAGFAVHEAGYGMLAARASVITGSEGNREFFLHLAHGRRGLEDHALEAALDGAVAEP